MGSIVAIAISILPILLFYSYRLFPATPSWDNFLFNFSSGYYNDVNTSIWVLVGKLVPLYLLVIWYFTNKSWWREALFAPISMYIVQIVIYFNDEIKFKDEIDGLFTVPFLLAVLIVLFVVRRKLKNYIDGIGLVEQIENDLNNLKNN